MLIATALAIGGYREHAAKTTEAERVQSLTLDAYLASCNVAPMLSWHRCLARWLAGESLTSSAE